MCDPPVVDALIPVTETLFASFNLIYMLVVGTVGLLTVVALHPRKNRMTLTMEQVDAIMPSPPELPEKIATPARMRSRGWIEGHRSMPRVTARGRAVLLASLPAWDAAQHRARELLGSSGVLAISQMASRLLSEPRNGGA